MHRENVILCLTDFTTGTFIPNVFQGEGWIKPDAKARVWS